MGCISSFPKREIAYKPMHEGENIYQKIKAIQGLGALLHGGKSDQAIVNSVLESFQKNPKTILVCTSIDSTICEVTNQSSPALIKTHVYFNDGTCASKELDALQSLCLKHYLNVPYTEEEYMKYIAMRLWNGGKGEYSYYYHELHGAQEAKKEALKYLVWAYQAYAQDEDGYLDPHFSRNDDVHDFYLCMTTLEKIAYVRPDLVLEKKDGKFYYFTDGTVLGPLGTKESFYLEVKKIKEEILKSRDCDNLLCKVLVISNLGALLYDYTSDMDMIQLYLTNNETNGKLVIMNLLNAMSEQGSPGSTTMVFHYNDGTKLVHSVSCLSMVYLKHYLNIPYSYDEYSLAIAYRLYRSGVAHFKLYTDLISSKEGVGRKEALRYLVGAYADYAKDKAGYLEPRLYSQYQCDAFIQGWIKSGSRMIEYLRPDLFLDKKDGRLYYFTDGTILSL